MTRIEYDPAHKVWLFTTPNTSYAVHLTAEEEVAHLHWGAPIHLSDAIHLADTAIPTRRRTAETPLDGTEEYPVEGGLRYGRPALSVRFGDEVRGIEWHLDGSEILTEGNASELWLRFHDRVYPLEITLHYRVYEDSDVLERWVEITHRGAGTVGDTSASADDLQGSVDILTAHSAAWVIPFRDDYRLSHLHGHWGGETRLERVPLSPASSFTIGSRTGVTGHFTNPWFAVDDATAAEEQGEVWSGALAWSGTWQLVAQRFANGRAQVVGGFGHDGFATWLLRPGETLTTPVFAGLYSAHGFGAASREWHTYQLRHVLPNAGELRPVLYNSWEATHFDIDEHNQKAIARVAADLGVELFVMDDGWFGQRVDDRAGLGDWQPNPKRFPNGLTPLVDEVHRLGMRFGIWVEPEMVNPDSDLYREHPDWVYHYPTRARSESRNQLVLNVARPDVAAWMYDWLDELLGKHGIDYVKWDMNRPISQPGWPGEPDNPGRVWIEHVRNVYDILDRLRRAHPGVAFESCAGGGGRVDLGILARTDMVWTSDNTDAYDRLAIQDGFTQVYAPRVMSAWVTDSPNSMNRRTYSVRYRFHSAMAGLLGLGGNLLEWSPEELAEARELVAAYKRIRPVVQHGLLHRLLPPEHEELTAVEYVARDGSEAVVLAFAHARRFGADSPPLRLRGLDLSGHYRDAESGRVGSGAVLTHHGLSLPLRGDLDSCLIHLLRED